MQNIYLTRAEIWIDFAYLSTTYLGIFNYPYNSVAVGVENMIEPLCPSELPTLWLKAGTTNETVTIDKPMQLRACGGTARIGG